MAEMTPLGLRHPGTRRHRRKWEIVTFGSMAPGGDDSGLSVGSWEAVPPLRNPGMEAQSRLGPGEVMKPWLPWVSVGERRSDDPLALTHPGMYEDTGGSGC